MEKNILNKSNSYLTFKLSDEIFAAHVSKVLNILEMVRITKVPKAPDYMIGVINLRGEVLPVIDTRIKFGMPLTEHTVHTCIIVMNIEMDGKTLDIGALVDAVQEVIEVDASEILPPPSIGNKYKSEFITGMISYGEQFMMLLDIDKVLTSDELITINQTKINDEFDFPGTEQQVE